MKVLSGPPSDGSGNTARRISSLVARLLSHFWTADDHPAAREAQITDWIGDLMMFGPDIVSKACGEWRRAQTKRPTIADIRRLCVEFHASERAHYAIIDGRGDPYAAADFHAKSAGWASALERQDAIDARQAAIRRAEEDRGVDPLAQTPLGKPNYARMAANGRELIDRWARAKGYANIDDYAVAKGIPWEAAYREHIEEVLKDSPMNGGMRAFAGPGEISDERAFDAHRKLTETGKYRALQTALGVTAHEWSPEEMAEARRQIPGMGE